MSPMQKPLLLLIGNQIWLIQIHFIIRRSKTDWGIMWNVLLGETSLIQANSIGQMGRGCNKNKPKRATVACVWKWQTKEFLSPRPRDMYWYNVGTTSVQYRYNIGTTQYPNIPKIPKNTQKNPKILKMT